jgi:DNA replication and repair protein RecF
MILHRLKLRNFRNYAEANLSFAPGMNLIVGDNGQGKTSLLEAISLLSTGRSFRTHTLSEMISFGAPFFALEAEFEREGVRQTLSMYYDTKERRLIHNDTTYSTFHSLLGLFPSVFITPQDVELITGAPAERRRFLDLHCAQMNPLYIPQLGRYFRALQQRNQLLRSAQVHTLSTWEELMATSGALLMRWRESALNALAAKLVTCPEPLTLTYRPSPAALSGQQDPQLYLKQTYAKLRPKEQLLGNTLIGVQRDDIAIERSHHAARAFSSEGQKRACIASLKLGQWQLMQEALHIRPLVGMDDFGIQLDTERLLFLEEALSALGQVFLTTPHLPSHHLFSGAHRIRIKNGAFATM